MLSRKKKMTLGQVLAAVGKVSAEPKANDEYCCREAAGREHVGNNEPVML